MLSEHELNKLRNVMNYLEKFKDKWHTSDYWVTPYNWLPEVRSWIKAPEYLIIHDATIREGQQTPGIAFHKEEIIRIAIALDELGVDRIEVVPMISDEDKEATKEIVKRGLNAKVIAFVSWDKKVIEEAINLDVDGVMVDFIGNPWQGKVFWRMKPEEITAKGLEAVSYAKSHGLYVAALIWDDFKSPLDFLYTHLSTIAREGHADSIAIADTYGQALPWSVYYIASMVKEWIRPATLEFHVHNDFGLATANALAAVAAGASAVHTTIAGLGERAGNAPTEEVALAAELLLGVKTNIKKEKIYYVTQLIQEIAKFRVGPNKPIIGTNAFRFSSGWLYYMIKKAREAGEEEGMLPFKPELIGRRLEFIVSKASGGTLIIDKLESLGVKIPQDILDKVVKAVKYESSIKKAPLTDEELLYIAKKILEQKS
jgi:isopropylmalate/homocitrate/citramalate synthase